MCLVNDHSHALKQSKRQSSIVTSSKSSDKLGRNAVYLVFNEGAAKSPRLATLQQVQPHHQSTQRQPPHSPRGGAHVLTRLLEVLQTAMVLLSIMEHYALHGIIDLDPCREEAEDLLYQFVGRHHAIFKGIDVATDIEQLVVDGKWQHWFSRMFYIYGPKLSPMREVDLGRDAAKFTTYLEKVTPSSFLLLNLMHFFLLHQLVTDPCHLVVMSIFRIFKSSQDLSLKEYDTLFTHAKALKHDGLWDTFYLQMLAIYRPELSRYIVIEEDLIVSDTASSSQLGGNSDMDAEHDHTSSSASERGVSTHVSTPVDTSHPSSLMQTLTNALDSVAGAFSDACNKYDAVSDNNTNSDGFGSSSASS
ncbi:hypothetical protein MPSEU_001086900 [Mayamaea pseudoterrestris]|nr:hypothetical protein MPSEU_001086900 [Mayamaea pseudoterrestris]